jgi:energy-coupling factor transporter transmembrane protein EcfT
MAMQSRGFRGEVYILDEFSLHTRDYVAMPVIALICGLGIWFGIIVA